MGECERIWGILEYLYACHCGRGAYRYAWRGDIYTLSPLEDTLSKVDEGISLTNKVQCIIIRPFAKPLAPDDVFSDIGSGK